MTALAYAISAVLTFAHLRLIGPQVLPWLSVWVAWFGVTSIALLVQASLAKRPEIIVPALIIFANYVVSNWVWVAHIPKGLPPAELAEAFKSVVTIQAAKYVLIASLLVLVFFRWPRGNTLVVAGIFGGTALAAWFAVEDILPINRGGDRTSFLRWSYPDIAMVLGHASMLVLSLPDRMPRQAGMAVDSPSGFGGVVVHPARMAAVEETPKG